MSTIERAAGVRCPPEKKKSPFHAINRAIDQIFPVDGRRGVALPTSKKADEEWRAWKARMHDDEGPFGKVPLQDDIEHPELPPTAAGEPVDTAAKLTLADGLSDTAERHIAEVDRLRAEAVRMNLGAKSADKAGAAAPPVFNGQRLSKEYIADFVDNARAEVNLVQTCCARITKMFRRDLDPTPETGSTPYRNGAVSGMFYTSLWMGEICRDAHCATGSIENIEHRAKGAAGGRRSAAGSIKQTPKGATP